MITLSIDVNLIDNARLKEVTRRDGKAAKFLEIVMIETPNDQYGNDYMVVQSASQEERASGKRGSILGNAKIFGGSRPAKTEQVKKPVAEKPKSDDPFD